MGLRSTFRAGPFTPIARLDHCPFLALGGSGNIFQRRSVESPHLWSSSSYEQDSTRATCFRIWATKSELLAVLGLYARSLTGHDAPERPRAMSNINANIFAYFALLVWPIVALYWYSRLPVAQATLWTILGGYLLLPDGLDLKLKMIPVFNKETIPNLAAFIGCVVYARRPLGFISRRGLAEMFVLAIVIGPFITSMLNGDSIQIGNTVLPGVGPYDAGSNAIYVLIFILPFFIGRQFFRTVEDNAQILRIMVVAGLAYSLLMLFEVRMSPQLSNWIYGYTPQSIAIEFRAGGFRPVVFLRNGLLVALFAMTSAVAGAALWRTKRRIGRWPPGGVTGYLSFVLVLCKSLGALLYCTVAVPLVRWASPRMQLRVACVLVIIALAYPVLRISDLVPTTSILNAARLVSIDRADSLNTRFVQEDQLLAHAWQRPWFGWGRYGRSRVYNGWNGADNSITDGYWIIVLGQFGLVGFTATFGLLALTVFRASSALKFARSPYEAEYLAALALIVSFNVMDSLPNSSITPWTWLLVGALLGRAEALQAEYRQKVRFQHANVPIGHPAS